MLTSDCNLDSKRKIPNADKRMITEWQIQSFSRKCMHSGTSFESGDRVLCLLIEHLTEGLQRMDILPEHEEALKIEGNIVGRWFRTIKPPDESHKEAKKQQEQSTEDLFVSMADAVPVDERSNSTKSMLYIIALFLERRKILKTVKASGIPQNYTAYMHTKTKTEYLVEDISMNPENMAHIENNLNILSGKFESDAPSAPAETSEKA
jgi:hypothetical protein